MVLSMNRWQGKVAVVTGTSSGIGYAIATALVQNGLKVVGLARRIERLEELKEKLKDAKGQFFPKKCDITKEEDIVKLFQCIKVNIGPISIIINNAGVAPEGTILNGDYKQWKLIFDTNVLGLCTCTREAVKQMNEANIAGHIIHINSIVGHSLPKDSPSFSVYPASKYGVTAITEIMRVELRNKGSKIKVTSVSPGLVESEMSTKGSWEIETLNFIKQLPILKAEDIADGVVYALSTPEHVQVHELTIKPVGEIF